MTHSPKIPMKGPILYALLVCVALAAFGRVTERRAQKLAELRGQVEVGSDATRFEPIDLGSTQDLDEQLAGYMPFGGADLAAMGLLQEPATSDKAPKRTGRRDQSVEAVRARRPEGWVYPEFDKPSLDSLHGPPPTAVPRNVTVQVLGASGEPLVLDKLEGVQTGPDGVYRVKAYRVSDDPTLWSIGSPAITPGNEVHFALSGTSEGGEWRASARVDRVDSAGDVALGAPPFEPR